MNKVILCGRLTRDPEIRYSQSGAEQMAIARYTIAVDRRRGRNNQDPNAQTADFISIVAFGKSAEFAQNYLHKGTKMIVSGRIQTGSYTNKDGQKVYTTEVVAEDQEFAESKNAGANTAVANGYQQPVQQPIQQPVQQGFAQQGFAPAAYQQQQFAAPAGGDGFMNIPQGIEYELPFV